MLYVYPSLTHRLLASSEPALPRIDFPALLVIGDRNIRALARFSVSHIDLWTLILRLPYPSGERS